MMLVSFASPIDAMTEPSAARAVATKRQPETDWSGQWFAMAEREHGFYVGMRGGQRLADGSVSWIFPSHAKHDGLGGFVHVLRQVYPDRTFRIPERKSRMPTWWKRIGAFLKLLTRPPIPAAAWKGWDESYSNRDTSPGVEFAHGLFDEATTHRLLAGARKHAVPLNSLLLSTLARASRPDLDDGPVRWMMPVNMRGPVALADDTANHAGYLQIDIANEATPSQVHEQVKLALARRDHWATWMFLNLPRYVGYAGIRRIFKLQMSRFGHRPFVGSFTNLGPWNNVGEWSVCPLVTKTSPVGVGVIICDGRLSLTVEAHKSVAREAGWTRALLTRWMAALEASA